MVGTYIAIALTHVYAQIFYMDSVFKPVICIENNKSMTIGHK